MKQNAGLKFVRELVLFRGQLSEEMFRRVCAAVYNATEIAEVSANVALAVFANYFNHIAGTEVDFPKVSTTLEDDHGDAPSVYPRQALSMSRFGTAS